MSAATNASDRGAAAPATPTIPQIRVAALRLVTDFLAEIGAPVDRLLTRAHLPSHVLQNGDALVPFPAVHRFLDVAAGVGGVADLGLEVGMRSPFSGLGPLAGRVLSAPTLGDALRVAHALLPRHSTSERGWLTLQGGEIDVHYHQVPNRDHDGQDHAVAMGLAMHLHLLRAAAGPGFRPLRVGLQAAPSAAYRRPDVLGDTPIRFGRPWTTITVPVEALALPMPHPAGTIPADWREPDPADDFPGSMRQVVSGLLPAGYPDIRLVAEVVGLSVRTAQRRLASAGTTYGDVVATARFDLARRMLAHPRQKMIDVALELGYSDPAHFTRAFRRWAGMTPRAFQRAHADGAS